MFLSNQPFYETKSVKQHFLCAGIAAGLFMVVGFFCLNYVSLGAIEDDAIYVGLGSELISHFQYRIPCFPTEPLCGKYPPLYPLLLGLFSLVLPSLPSGIPFLKTASLAFTVPGVFFFALWIFRRFADKNLHPSIAWLTVFIVAVHAYVLFISRELMSEGLFLTLITICLWRSNAAQEKVGTFNVRTYAWLFVLCILMFYTRSIGIIFILSLIAFVLYKRQIMWALIMGAAATVAVFPWFWWSRYWVPAHEPMSHIMPYFVSYNYHVEALKDFLLEEPGGLVEKISWYASANFVTTMHGIEAMIFPSDTGHSPASSITSLGITSFFAVIFVCIGLFRSLYKGECVSFFMAGYVFLVAVWPWSNKLRFMIPIAPILICYFVEGIVLLHFRYVRLRNIVTVMLCVGALLTNLLWSFKINAAPSTLFVRMYGTESKSSVQKDALLQSIEWINENVSKDDIIFVSDGGLVYYAHTGRYTVPYRTLVFSPAEHLQSLYDPVAYTRPPSLVSPAIERIMAIYSDRQFYRLDILSKKNITDKDTISDISGTVFADHAKDGRIIVIRKLFSLHKFQKIETWENFFFTFHFLPQDNSFL